MAVSLEQFMISASEGDLAVIYNYIEENRTNPAALNALEYGSTALMLAVRSNKRNAVAALIAAGADPNVGGGPAQRTALMEAVANGDTHITSMLLAIPNINLLTRDVSNMTAQDIAVMHGHREILTLINNAIVERTESPLVSPPPESTPARRALTRFMVRGIGENNFEIVNTYIQENRNNPAAFNISVINNATPLIIAASRGRRAIVAALLTIPHINLTARTLALVLGPTPYTAAEGATRNGFHDVATLITNAIAERARNTTQIPVAPSSNPQPSTSSEVQVITTTQSSSSSITRSEFIDAAPAGNLEVVNRYIEENRNNLVAAINVVENGRTALLLSVMYNHENIVTVLLAAGADPNVGRGILQRTTLMEAAMIGNVGIVTALLAVRNIDLTAEDENHNNALDLAAQSSYYHIVRLLNNDLIRRQAPGTIIAPSPPANLERSFVRFLNAIGRGDIEAARSYIEANRNDPLDFNCSIANNMTPLMAAAALGRSAIVIDLLTVPGIDLNIRTLFSPHKSALDWATSRGHNDIVSLLNNARLQQYRNVVQAQRAIRQNFIIRDRFFTAVRNGNMAAVTAYITTNGSDSAAMNLEDSQGNTALTLAAAAGHRDIVNALLLTSADIGLRNQGRRAALVAQRSLSAEGLQIAAELMQLVTMREAGLVAVPVATTATITTTPTTTPTTTTQSSSSASAKKALPPKVIIDPNSILKEINYTGEIPEHLCCPGTNLNELMIDPVSLPTGFTYERSFLVELFKHAQGGVVHCPMSKEIITQEVLKIKTSVAVKQGIDAFVLSKKKEKTEKDAEEARAKQVASSSTSTQNETKPLTIEQMRQARLKFFDINNTPAEQMPPTKRPTGPQSPRPGNQGE